jgi:hypothetical protein
MRNMSAAMMMMMMSWHPRADAGEAGLGAVIGGEAVGLIRDAARPP